MKSINRWIYDGLIISFVVFSLVCFGSLIKNQTAGDAAAAFLFPPEKWRIKLFGSACFVDAINFPC